MNTVEDWDASAERMRLAEAPLCDLLRAVLQESAASAAPHERAHVEALVRRFVDGYDAYIHRGASTEQAFHAYRELYVASRGAVDVVANRKLAELFPPRNLAVDPASLVAALTSRSAEAHEADLARQSYTLFDGRLAPDVCRELRAHIDAAPADAVTSLAKGQHVRIHSNYLLEHEGFARIATDPMLTAIAEKHLGCAPVLVDVQAWTSQHHDMSDRELAEYAYRYHYDKDNFRFVKAFVTLCDLPGTDGGQGYVPGTHDVRPEAFWPIARHSDEAIAAAFTNPPPFLVGCEMGRVSMMNTAGFHKGIPARSGRRVFVQVEYANSLFTLDPKRLVAAPSQRFFDMGPRFNAKLRFAAPPEREKPRVAVAAEPPADSRREGEGTQASAAGETPIVVPPYEGALGDARVLGLVLDTIWPGPRFANLKRALEEKFAPTVSSLNYDSLLDSVEPILRSLVGGGSLPADGLSAFYRHRAQVLESRIAYDARHRVNPLAVYWPNPSLPPERGGRPLHGELPFAQRKKTISKATPIGSAGSCFAIEIKKYLVEHGFNYVATEESHYGSANWGGQFNLVAFQQTVEWAFGLRERPPLIWECSDLGKKEFWDPFREGIVHPSREGVLADVARHRVAARRALEEVEYFVLTAGLNELWRLTSSDHVLARYPRNFAPYLIRSEVLTVQQNIDALQRTLDVLQSFNPRIRMIVTVSPVPLNATVQANEKHVIEATVHAKSVLRVAVDEFARRNAERVTYFPAFETVMWCSKDAWEADTRHVRRETVGNVMRLFEEVFLV